MVTKLYLSYICAVSMSNAILSLFQVSLPAGFISTPVQFDSKYHFVIRLVYLLLDFTCSFALAYTSMY